MSDEEIEQLKQERDEYKKFVNVSTSLARKVVVLREALKQYARPDYYLFLLDPVGQQTDPTKKARDALRETE